MSLLLLNRFVILNIDIENELSKSPIRVRWNKSKHQQNTSQLCATAKLCALTRLFITINHAGGMRHKMIEPG